jgi:hypothetical protein
MKNPAVPKAFGTGYLNVMKHPFLYPPAQKHMQTART